MKILFIANIDEKSVLPSYIQDFISKGHDVRICKISGMFPRWNIIVRLKKMFSIDVRENVRIRKKNLESKIIAAVEDYCPDIVCEINGMMLNSHCAEIIRKKAFLIANMIDRVSFFPEYYEEGFSKHYDVIYTYSLDDYKMINGISGNCVFIPSVCESNVYHNDCMDRDIDVSFVGRMYPEKDYGERYKILRMLVADFPELNIYIGGECAPLRRLKRFIEWNSNPLFKKAFVNRQISKIECNSIYNRSKIALSIERNGTGNSWSGRLVNMFGTATFVLALDDSEMLKKYFKGCYVHFDNYDDLKEKIIYYMNHEDERAQIAAKAYRMVHELETNPFSNSLSDDVISRVNCLRGSQ